MPILFIRSNNSSSELASELPLSVPIEFLYASLMALISLLFLMWRLLFLNYAALSVASLKLVFVFPLALLSFDLLLC